MPSSENWQINVIERATSGFPLFVVDSTNPSGVDFSYNGLTVSRPDQVGDPNKPGPEGGRTDCPAQVHTHANWFNPCAFASAPPANSHRCPRSALWSSFREHRFLRNQGRCAVIPRGMGLQFRAEIFNLFNHPQFFMNGISATGEQDIGTPSSFGVLNGTVNNPRLVQLALKLKF